MNEQPLLVHHLPHHHHRHTHLSSQGNPFVLSRHHIQVMPPEAPSPSEAPSVIVQNVVSGSHSNSVSYCKVLERMPKRRISAKDEM
ncbi:hypothetical protein J437_LFUL005987 [Ladona fulva]|uniref:Uncharacterized protein n=1 Tax=Ladona fulva TaxID=123851 RepID=A0A8K0NZT7_LADFU|nr:hypothetical protein J437_LFUL005987 [Ladona fulva]